MDDFPSRVTLYEDGVYRWSYDMDMWHNRYMLTLLIKVLGVICGAVVLTFMILLGPTYITPPVLTLIAGLVAGVYVLSIGIYAICALAMHGNYRLRFEMDGDTVALVRSAASKATVGTLAAVASVVGLAAGKPGEVLRMNAGVAASNAAGVTAFSAVRRVKLVPECDVIDLREIFGMNQLYVGPEDFNFVRDFILERVPERARR